MRFEKHKIGDVVKFTGRSYTQNSEGKFELTNHPLYGIRGVVLEVYQNREFKKVMGVNYVCDLPGYKVQLQGQDEPMMDFEDKFYKVRK